MGLGHVETQTAASNYAAIALWVQRLAFAVGAAGIGRMRYASSAGGIDKLNPEVLNLAITGVL